MPCPYCGKEIPENMVSCPDCEQDLEAIKTEPVKRNFITKEPIKNVSVKKAPTKKEPIKRVPVNKDASVKPKKEKKPKKKNNLLMTVVRFVISLLASFAIVLSVGYLFLPQLLEIAYNKYNEMMIIGTEKSMEFYVYPKDTNLMDECADAIKNRLEMSGKVINPYTRDIGDGSILVSMLYTDNNADDIAPMISVLTNQGNIVFNTSREAPTSPVFSNKDIKDATFSMSNQYPLTKINFRFTNEGTDALSKYTAENKGKTLTVWIDDKAYVSAMIPDEVTDGVLGLGMTEHSYAWFIPTLIKYPLPCPVQYIKYS